MRSSLDGVIVVDKPEGLTSQQAISALKKHFHFRDKIGHAGALDPLATGVLVVLLGRATKLQSVFLKAQKRYSGTILLGEARNTDDVTGNVCYQALPHSLPTLEDFRRLENELSQTFTGTIPQVPPRFSAIKQEGVRAYEQARKGEAIVLHERDIYVERLSLSFRDSRELDYCLECSSGTYVRGIARDIGILLGVGGCVKTIRREYSAPFDISEAIHLDALLASSGDWTPHIRPLSVLGAKFPKIELPESECTALLQGKKSFFEVISAAVHRIEGRVVLLIGPEGRLVGFAEKGEGDDVRIKPLG